MSALNLAATALLYLLMPLGNCIVLDKVMYCACLIGLSQPQQLSQRGSGLGGQHAQENHCWDEAEVYNWLQGGRGEEEEEGVGYWHDKHGPEDACHLTSRRFLECCEAWHDKQGR